VVGMLPACTTDGTRAAPRAAYFQNFNDAADDISKGSQNPKLLNQPGTPKVGHPLTGWAIPDAVPIADLVVALDSFVTNRCSRSKSRWCRLKSTQLLVSEARPRSLERDFCYHGGGIGAATSSWLRRRCLHHGVIVQSCAVSPEAVVVSSWLPSEVPFWLITSVG
jgi:hypothetical protein